ncbi:pilus assembly protein TadG-related protein [Shewanella sp. 4_MG-2023]|uniref:pilus assembly protein TadG-related protein n=1 Tax=Shewanella sp. 4_MG-2023 TaxID=3062652 RepID=UPI0026E29C9B|nr:pilus assembly protein TadG-related protein [Shewanella sp. 4_MG-2023]MDO6678122.1 pilus assembly protein TadG-related protein [Shewanella sp. 4_MG-2023]
MYSTTNCHSKGIFSGKGRQCGAILVMFTIGLFSLLAVAALALDGGHLLLSKGRLQNAVDASALHAAKVLDGGATLAEARQAAVSMLSQNMAFKENNELETNISFSPTNYSNNAVTNNIVVEFSVLPDPFTPVSIEGSEYVRVRVEDVGLDNFFAQLLSFNKRVRASAVAGRSTDIICNNRLVPLLVCAVNDDPNFTTTNANGVTVPAPYGIATNSLYAMKSGAEQANAPAIGPGNFQLLALDGTGADILRSSLAGEYTPNSCIGAGDIVPTEPGNKVGPVSQGINTRFGKWQGGGLNSIDHPRDRNICQGDRINLDGDGNIDNPTAAYYSHAQYLADNDTNSCIDSNIAANNRRAMPVVIGVCDGLTNGRNNIEVKTIGCFFLVQDVDKGGKESFVVGEFVSECPGTGNASVDPNFVSNNYTIVLYRDPDSPDS